MDEPITLWTLLRSKVIQTQYFPVNDAPFVALDGRKTTKNILTEKKSAKNFGRNKLRCRKWRFSSCIAIQKSEITLVCRDACVGKIWSCFSNAAENDQIWKKIWRQWMYFWFLMPRDGLWLRGPKFFKSFRGLMQRGPFAKYPFVLLQLYFWWWTLCYYYYYSNNGK